MTTIVRNTLLSAAMLAAAAALVQPLGQKIHDIREDDMMRGAATMAAQSCAEHMVAGAKREGVFINFPDCDSMTLKLPNGNLASVTFQDSQGITDTAKGYAYYGPSTGINDRTISFPYGTSATAIVAVEGKEPVRSETRFDQTAAWASCTRGWGICESVN